MYNPKYNANTKCAVTLIPLGIYTTVMTTMGEIEETQRELEETPDHAWCNGLGKDHLFKILTRKLKAQDVYFTNNPKKVKHTNPKWIDFCNDCLLLYVLNAMRNGNVFHLVHPTQYRENIKKTLLDGTSGRLPDYIPGIPTIH